MNPLPASLAERFQAPLLLGRGGFGVVLRCRDVRLERPVALKLLAPAQAQGEEARRNMLARFEREAALAARLKDPHVVQVFDYGVAEGQAYIVYEFYPSVDLWKLLGRHPHGLAQARALTIARQLLDGLAAVHAAGIVHRDVKPGNVLVGDGDAVKLTDFGLCREEQNSDLTRQGMLVGTPEYAPLEAYLGEPPAPSGDVYAAGLVLHFMLTGASPFRGTELRAILEAKRAQECFALPEDGAFPGPLRELVAGLTAQASTRRPPHGAAAAAALREVEGKLRGRPSVQDSEPARAPAPIQAPESGPRPLPGTPVAAGSPSPAPGAKAPASPRPTTARSRPPARAPTTAQPSTPGGFSYGRVGIALVGFLVFEALVYWLVF